MTDKQGMVESTRRPWDGLPDPWSKALFPGDRPVVARTCPSCGLLLHAARFRKSGAGVRARTCKACAPSPGRNGPRRKRRQAKRYNADSQDGARNRYQPWTLWEMEVLEDESLTRKEKAAATGRTYEAVAHRMWLIRRDKAE